MSSNRDSAVCVKRDIINVWLTDRRVEREKTNDCGRPDSCDRHVHCSVNMRWQKNLCADPVRLFSCLDLTPEEQPNMWEWEISWIKSVQIFLFSLCGYISILLYKNMSSPPPFLLMYVVQQCEKMHAYIFSWHFLSLVLSFQPLGDIDSCSRCVSGWGVSLGKSQG